MRILISASSATALLASAFQVAVGIASTPNWERPLISQSRKIEAAAKLDDAGERRLRMEDALKEGLLASDPEIRSGVFDYLWKTSRWIDFGPFAGIFLEHDAEYHSHRGAWFLDMNQLQRKSYNSRREIYEHAIRNGSVDLEYGRPLSRFQAVERVSWEGVVELAPLVRQYFSAIPIELQSRFSQAEFEITLDLCAGGEDRTTAANLAVARVEALEDTDFRQRMNGDGGFRNAVLKLSSFVCAVDPFRNQTGSVNSCDRVQNIYKRQRRLQLEEETGSSWDIQKSEESFPRESSLPEASLVPSWLETLGELSGQIQ